MTGNHRQVKKLYTERKKITFFFLRNIDKMKPSNERREKL